MPTEAEIQAEEVPEVHQDAEQEYQAPQKPQKVTFSAEQQQRLDELIREAQGRAARELRAERDQLKDELAKLRERTPPSAEEAATLEERVTQAKAQLGEVETATRTARREAMLLAAAEAAEFIDGSMASELMRNHVEWIDGELRPVGKDGSPLLDRFGDPMSVQDYAKSLATSHAYMVRSTARGGAGSSEARASLDAAAEPQLEALFGRRSRGDYANKFSLSHPAEYRRLRQKAQDEGLI